MIGNEGADNAPQDDPAQVSAQQDGTRPGCRAWGEPWSGVRFSGQDRHGSHQAHGPVLTLADDGGQGGNQDHGDIAEHGDGHDVSGETGGKFKVLSAEET